VGGFFFFFLKLELNLLFDDIAKFIQKYFFTKLRLVLL